MTNLFNMLSGPPLAALLTIVASATLVLGAVAPAYASPVSAELTMAGVAKVPGKPATSLA